MVCVEEVTDGEQVTCTLAALARDTADEGVVQFSTSELKASILESGGSRVRIPGENRIFPSETVSARARLEKDTEEGEKPAAESEEKLNGPPQL